MTKRITPASRGPIFDTLIWHGLLKEPTVRVKRPVPMDPSRYLFANPVGRANTPEAPIETLELDEFTTASWDVPITEA